MVIINKNVKNEKRRLRASSLKDAFAFMERDSTGNSVPCQPPILNRASDFLVHKWTGRQRQPAQRSLTAQRASQLRGRCPPSAPASSEVADRSVRQPAQRSLPQCASQLRGRCPPSAPTSSCASQLRARCPPWRQPAQRSLSEVAVRPGVAASPLTNPHGDTMMR